MVKFLKYAAAILMAIMLVTASGLADAQNIKIEAKNIENAPTLDGIISEGEWGDPIFSGSPLDENAPFFIPDSIDRELIPTDIKIYVTWDNESLYIAAVVTDPLHWNGNVGADCWMGDGLQIDICVNDNNQKSKWRTNTAYSTVDGNTYAYVNSVPNAAQDGYEFAGDPQKTDAQYYYGCAKASLNGNTVTYETSYPWVLYGNRATIEAGHSVLVNIAFYVADGTKGEGEGATTYLGYIAYGNSAEGKLNYPLLVLDGQKIQGQIQDSSTNDQQDTPGQTQDSNTNDGLNDTDSNSTLIFVMVAAGVVIVAAVVVVFVIIVKKKQK